MPEGGTIAGFLFTDFSFANDGGEMVESQNGPFTLPANATATLAVGAEQMIVNIDDDDTLFEDGFQEPQGLGAGSQSLVETVSTVDTNGDTVTFTSGQVAEVEFTLTATPVGGGDPIQLLFVAFGASENAGDLGLVVSTAPLVPGATYNISFANDGGGAAYGDLICFVGGTMIETPNGPRPVEDLAPGDVVTRYGGGAAKVTWVGARHITATELAARPEFHPIRIPAGALGAVEPRRDLYVSPQHRVLLRGRQAMLCLGASEVLATAGALVGWRGIERAQARGVTYHHVMCDQHEILISDGAPTESFFPGETAIRGLDAKTRDELYALFPDLDAYGAAARPVLKNWEVAALRV